MQKYLKLCLVINKDIIHKFSGQINEKTIVTWTKKVEKILISNNATKDKIRSVVELFIETLQNVLHYSYLNNELNEKGISCELALHYFTKSDTYILESCNLIEKRQKNIIEERVSELRGLDNDTLRKLIRKKGRLKEDSHANGAGLGYIMMARKTSAPISIEFLPHKKEILRYKQRLFI